MVIIITAALCTAFIILWRRGIYLFVNVQFIRVLSQGCELPAFLVLQAPLCFDDVESIYFFFFPVCLPGCISVCLSVSLSLARSLSLSLSLFFVVDQSACLRVGKRKTKKDCVQFLRDVIYGSNI